MCEKKKFALIILTDEIKVKQFCFEDDFVMARQTTVTNGTKCIPLKWHEGAQVWMQPEVCE